MVSLSVCVCQLPSNLNPEHPAWQGLQEHVSRLSPDLLLLNEMPFGPWVAGSSAFDDAAFTQLCREADTGQQVLPNLGAGAVLGTRPARRNGRRVNEAFVWTRLNGYQAVHTKQYFPEEPGFHESCWFEGGDPHFNLVEVGGIKVGFLICTEVMWNERARTYGRNGADIICVPRATEKASLPRWRVAACMAALVSGAFVLSSNRQGVDGGVEFAGGSFVIDPVGTCLAETTADTPVAVVSIDIDQARRQKSRYPLYVPELPQ